MQKQTPIIALFAAIMLSASATAHFPWLSTDAEGHALLFFGESPDQQDYHLPEAVGKASVNQFADKGKPQACAMESVDTEHFVGNRSKKAVPDKGMLQSKIEYGIYHDTNLTYYAQHAPMLDKVPSTDFHGNSPKLYAKVHQTFQGGVGVRIFWNNKPLKGASVQLYCEEDQEEAEKITDAKGYAEFSRAAIEASFDAMLIGHVEQSPGELDGKKFKSASNYLTVTFHRNSTVKSHKPEASHTTSATPDSDLSELPAGLASFGGAVHEGWLYVYSGHIGGAHDHSRDNLSQSFQRLKLAGGSTWEELPMQTPLQGLALVAHETGLYRIGGLIALNAPEDDEDLHSTTEFARFDPTTKKWTRLADLPDARSSHDAVVLGDKLYVAGGWTLAGDCEGTWLDEAIVFDLGDPSGNWKALPKAPFKRRALAVSHWQGQLVVLGGMDSEEEISFDVNLYNPTTETWTQGPDLPWKGMEGFGVSAWNLGGELYVSGLADSAYRLSSDGKNWTKAISLKIPRFFHQLLPLDKESLIAVAGASRRGHLKHIEKLTVPAKSTNAQQTVADTAKASLALD